MTLAWASWVALATTIVWSWGWWQRRHQQFVAPLPIAVATIGFYVLPRSAYLLAFHHAPLTSGGLVADQQVALITRTLLYTLVAMLAFLLGHANPGAVRVAQRVRLSLPDPEYGRAVVVGGACAFLGLGALAYLLISLGGLHGALAHQAELAQLGSGQMGVFQVTRLLVVPVALLIVDTERRRTRWWVWMAALIAVVAVIPLGRRSFILLAAGYPIGLYHLCVRRIPARTLGIVALLGAVALFSFSYVRLLGVRRIWEARSILVNKPDAVLRLIFATGELKIFDAETIIVRDTPDRLPYDYGLAFARVPAMIVPRTIWVTKPVTIGEIIVEKYLPYLRTGYPPTAIGALLVAADLPAVILGFLILGWLGRVWWEWHTTRTGVGNASLYIAFSYFMYDFIRVGDPSRTVWFFLIGAASLLVTFSIAARPPTSAPARSGPPRLSPTAA